MPVSDTFALGRNAQEYWLVDNNENVVIADNFQWMVAASERDQLELELLKELSVDSREVPLMQLSSVTQLMQHDYDIVLQGDVRDGDERVDKITGCKCGDVLKGIISPPDCKLFGKACQPEHPIGPCMVSSEGACAAFYRYDAVFAG